MDTGSPDPFSAKPLSNLAASLGSRSWCLSPRASSDMHVCPWFRVASKRWFACVNEPLQNNHPILNTCPAPMSTYFPPTWAVHTFGWGSWNVEQRAFIHTLSMQMRITPAFMHQNHLATFYGTVRVYKVTSCVIAWKIASLGREIQDIKPCNVFSMQIFSEWLRIKM